LTKPFADGVLLDAIRQALQRSRIELKLQAELRRLQECYSTLSGRELQVMALVVRGFLNKQDMTGLAQAADAAQRGM